MVKNILARPRWGSNRKAVPPPTARPSPLNTMEWAQASPAQNFDISPDDPVVAFLVKNPDVTEVDRLPTDSPTVSALKKAGIRLVVPLISQGELIGLMNLGPRLSNEDYSAEDRRLLGTLSAQAASALRVAQFVQQQRIEAVSRERLEHELRVARRIQQTLIPKDLPQLPGWEMASHYQPAYAVGGDFFDFIPLRDGRIVLIVADVSDKGVPAALVMATTRGILLGAAKRGISPGMVLERTNELLSAEIPEGMFVTCFCAVLDPASGCLDYANAGHNLPYCTNGRSVDELRATGMPLGLMPDMSYEEKQYLIAPGETLLLFSDGITEAHNPAREMFGNARLRTLLERRLDSSVSLVNLLLHELAVFTKPGWQQEDDITLLAVHRLEC